MLFAGSIGRTDLPGGDHAAMTRSLREKVLPLPDDTLVLPGHGPATTIGRERPANPYLLEARTQRLSGRPVRAPGRTPDVPGGPHGPPRPAVRLPRVAARRSGWSSSTSSTACGATFEL